jgi:hypothetical protein
MLAYVGVFDAQDPHTRFCCTKHKMWHAHQVIFLKLLPVACCSGSCCRQTDGDDRASAACRGVYPHILYVCARGVCVYASPRWRCLLKHRTDASHLLKHRTDASHLLKHRTAFLTCGFMCMCHCADVTRVCMHICMCMCVCMFLLLTEDILSPRVCLTVLLHHYVPCF